MTGIFLNGSDIRNKDDFFDTLHPQLFALAAKSLGEDHAIGRSLDAVYDILTDAAEEVKVHINNASEIFADDRQYYDRFMKMLRAAAGQNDNVTYEICEHGTGCVAVEDEEVMSTTEKAYAKINLSLDVTGRLPNGYHLVKMVMASISLYDELIFTLSDDPGIRLTMTDGDGTHSALSLGEDNLITKAARALPLDLPGLDITLNKNIPMAAGMAGGSADAAATLRALNRLYDLGLTTDELCEIGVRLGADVPFCVRQGCYLSEGIGEILTELPGLNNTLEAQGKKAFIALIKPPIDVSTKFVYEHLDTEGVSIHPDVDGQIEAIRSGSLSGIADRMRNVLRDVTVPAYPIVGELENFLKAEGALNAMMSGSGPTVFGIFEDEDKCRAAIAKAELKYPGMFTDAVTFM